MSLSDIILIILTILLLFVTLGIWLEPHPIKRVMEWRQRRREQAES